VRRFAARLTSFHDQHPNSAFAEEYRERQSNDPGPDDDYVPSLHDGIVKESTRSLCFFQAATPSDALNIEPVLKGDSFLCPPPNLVTLC
jgi:hypothetical protein